MALDWCQNDVSVQYLGNGLNEVDPSLYRYMHWYWQDVESVIMLHVRFQLNLSRLMTKPTKWHVRPAKTPISLGIRPVWSESSLSARRKLGSLATQWAHSEDSDQTGRMPRLIWVFAGRTVTLLVLSCRGSYKPSLGAPPHCWFCHEAAQILFKGCFCVV